MKTFQSICLPTLAATLASLSSAWAVDEDGFERYAVILSRMPFGEALVEEAPPPKPQPITTESFARALRVCSITESLGGGPIKVGIVDKGNNNAVILLAEGEKSPDGITLVSANIAEEEAVLQKGEEIALLKLGEEPVTPLSQQQLASRKTPTRAASYADRRRQRREELMNRSKEVVERPPPKYTGEALKAHLQEYNVEAIRNGLPALPIELTPAQDLQLVQEGVLPPAPGQLDAPVKAGHLVSGLPAELRDINIDDLSTEDLQLLLQQQ